MKRIAFLTLAIFVIGFVSLACAEQNPIKATGEGVVDVVEGVGTGTVELGKGAVGTVTNTTKATGQALVGKGKSAKASGKEAYESGKAGVTGAVEEPAKGVGSFFKKIWKSLRGE